MDRNPIHTTYHAAVQQEFNPPSAQQVVGPLDPSPSSFSAPQQEFRQSGLQVSDQPGPRVNPMDRNPIHASYQAGSYAAPKAQGLMSGSSHIPQPAPASYAASPQAAVWSPPAAGM